MLSTVHGPNPGNALSAARVAPQSLPAPRSRPSGQRLDQRRAACDGGCRGIASVSGIQRRQRLRRREQVRQAALGVVDRLAVGHDEPGRVGAGRRRRDLLAEHRPHGELGAVDRARHPAARRGRDQRREQRVGGELVVDGDRVGVEVQQAAAAAGRGRQVAQVGQAEPAGDVPGSGVPGAQRDDAVAVRQPQGPAVGAVPPLLDARHAGGDEVAEQVVRAERLPVRQPQRDRARRRGRLALRPLPQLGRREGEHLADGVVERPDAAEPGGQAPARSSAGWSSRSAIRAVCARWALASASGPAPSSANTWRSTCRTL